MLIEQEINKKIGEENKKEIKQENNIEIEEKEKNELEKEKEELRKELEKDETLNIIWLDKYIYTEENIKNFNDLLHILDNNIYGYKSYKFKRYLNISEALNYIKTINFESTIIIIGGELYYNFINKFIKNLSDIYIIPKIVIYTKNEEDFKDDLNSKNFSKILNDKFYNCKGPKTSFEEIKEFILDNINEFFNFEIYKIIKKMKIFWKEEKNTLLNM